MGAPSLDLPARGSSGYNEETVLNAEYKAFFEDGKMDNDSENIGNELYKI